MQLGDNVSVIVEGSKILIEIDASVSLGLSKSQKSYLVGTTHGFTNLPVGDGSVGISVNVTTPNPDYVKPAA